MRRALLLLPVRISQTPVWAELHPLGDVGPQGLKRHPDKPDEANCWFGSSARKTGSQYTKTKVHEILDQDARRANGARTAPVHELQLTNSKDLQIQSACIQ